jgi:BspA type Leucine rich repeat region (6 copies)
MSRGIAKCGLVDLFVPRGLQTSVAQSRQNQWFNPSFSINKTFAVLVALCSAIQFAQAQFNYTNSTYHGLPSCTITEYTGSGGLVIIPRFINGRRVTGIGDWSFYATSVTNVFIPDTVTNIGDGAFFDCLSLTNVSVGSSVVSIGDWMFAFCPELVSVCYRWNAPNLGDDNVFYGNAASIYYLPGTTNWGPTFDGHPAILWNPPVPFNYTGNSDGVTLTVTGYTGSNSAVDIPLSINFQPVGAIGTSVFYNDSFINSVTIPDSVTSVGPGAFAATGLTNVTIPYGVTSIGIAAFYLCNGLTSVSIPGSVTNIGYSAFESTSLSSVCIPDAVTVIQLETFLACTNLTNVTIGNGVTTIQESAFAYCTSLTSITIPNNVTVIEGAGGGAGAFDGCLNLTNVTIGNNVAVIGPDAFGGCVNLTSLIIPSSVTNLGEGVYWAFSGCNGLTSITVDTNNLAYSSVAGVLFNKGQTTLIQYPVANTGKSYTIPNSVTTIGSFAFAGCTSLTNVTIGNGVSSISDGAFNSCIGLTSVRIPDSVVSIGNWAFTGCGNLTNVTIGNGVISIGGGAFEVGGNLISVYFLGNAPSLNSSIIYAGPFYGDTATVYYLPGTTGWDTFNADSGLAPAVLWNPQATTYSVTGGQFGFNITGPSNTVIVVEACTDLANPVWLPVSTNALDASGSSSFSDSQSGNYPARFYRFRSP